MDKKKTKENKELREDMLLLYAEERNPILRQHALGNALEINMLQPRTGVS